MPRLSWLDTPGKGCDAPPEMVCGLLNLPFCREWFLESPTKASGSNTNFSGESIHFLAQQVRVARQQKLATAVFRLKIIGEIF